MDIAIGDCCRKLVVWCAGLQIFFVMVANVKAAFSYSEMV